MPPRKKSKVASTIPKKDVSGDKFVSPAPSVVQTRAKKRKNNVDSENEVEVTTSTKKKRTIQRSPSPGSEEFKKLPAVSLTDTVKTALANSKAIPLVFGSIDEDSISAHSRQETDAKGATPSVSPTRSRRVRKPTEKTRLDAAIDVISAVDSEDVKEVAEGPSHSRRSKQPGKSSTVSKKIHVDVEISSDDDIEEALANKKANLRNKVRKLVKSFIDDEASEDNESSDASCDAEVEKMETGVEEDPVMDRTLHDEYLVDFYEDLPLLRTFRDVVPFTTLKEDLPRATFTELSEVFSKKAMECLLKGLLFIRSGYFINTARIDPSSLSTNNCRLTMPDKRTNAVGIMIGIVTECNLVEPGIGGPVTMSYPIHKVSIAPFKQEMRRDTSCWGQVMGFRKISGPVSELGITFSTRRDFSGGQTEAHVASTSNSPRTPKRRGKLALSSVKSPLISGGSNLGDGYPISHAYDDKIPIYDGTGNSGRKWFGFTDPDFRALRSLPLYSKGLSDLPNDSLVAVGYTLNTYTGNSGAKILSANAQFVILLGLMET